MEQIDYLERITYKVRSPLQHQEYKLHNWIAYFILPLFAFSNAGVKIDFNTNFDLHLIQNIAISLFVGKFIGITLFTYLGIKFKLIELPKAIHFRHVFGIAAIAGVGFTMSIFIDNLAFAGDTLKIDSAKIGIILGSLLSGVLGYLILSRNKVTNG
jgi:NhaA family Na+:H+ antiporter